MRLQACLAFTFLLTACDGGDKDFDFQRINPENLTAHPAYSQVTTVSGDSRLIFIAGQTDVGPDHVPGGNDCRHDDWAGQLTGVVENVSIALAAAGATWDDVVFIRRFVLDMNEFRRALGNTENPQATLWVNRPPPPSTLIEVSALAEPCYLMEIDVFAAVAGDK